RRAHGLRAAEAGSVSHSLRRLPICTAAWPARRACPAAAPVSKWISQRHPPTEEGLMAAPPPKTEVQHPKGTLFLIGLYGVVFAAAWFAVYFLVYLRRGGVTP